MLIVPIVLISAKICGCKDNLAGLLEILERNKKKIFQCRVALGCVILGHHVVFSLIMK